MPPPVPASGLAETTAGAGGCRAGQGGAPAAEPAAAGLLELVGRDGAVRRMPVSRWMGTASPADLRLLAEALPPVLDVGCGPGRHVAALVAAGKTAVGLDHAPEAVRMARIRGVTALHGSVFGPLPGAGAWGSVLLLDGNVGIGGRPVSLLRRVAGLLRPGGRVLIDLEPPGTPTRSCLVHCRRDGHPTSGGWWAAAGTPGWFRWAEVSVDAIEGLAAAAGLRVARTWYADGRHGASLERG